MHDIVQVLFRNSVGSAGSRKRYDFLKDARDVLAEMLGVPTAMLHITGVKDIPVDTGVGWAVDGVGDSVDESGCAAHKHCALRLTLRILNPPTRINEEVLELADHSGDRPDRGSGSDDYSALLRASGWYNPAVEALRRLVEQICTGSIEQVPIRLRHST